MAQTNPQTQLVREVMTPGPVVLDAHATAAQAAERMRDAGVGDVLVLKDGALCGIVTDRDLVIRCMAEGADPASQSLGDLCTEELATLESGDSVDDAIELMKLRAVRRIPVLEGREPVGIVSLGGPGPGAGSHVRAGPHQRGAGGLSRPRAAPRGARRAPRAFSRRSPGGRPSTPPSGAR